MTEQETAEVLRVHVRTVRRDWIKARGLLFQALDSGAARDGMPSTSSREL
jgi:DNA-directed RNA polymerase specialized sigma24 family protein